MKSVQPLRRENVFHCHRSQGYEEPTSKPCQLFVLGIYFCVVAGPVGHQLLEQNELRITAWKCECIEPTLVTQFRQSAFIRLTFAVWIFPKGCKGEVFCRSKDLYLGVNAIVHPSFSRLYYYKLKTPVLLFIYQCNKLSNVKQCLVIFPLREWSVGILYRSISTMRF